MVTSRVAGGPEGSVSAPGSRSEGSAHADPPVVGEATLPRGGTAVASRADRVRGSAAKSNPGCTEEPTGEGTLREERLPGGEDAALLEPGQDHLGRNGGEQDTEDAAADVHPGGAHRALDVAPH